MLTPFRSPGVCKKTFATTVSWLQHAVHRVGGPMVSSGVECVPELSITAKLHPNWKTSVVVGFTSTFRAKYMSTDTSKTVGDASSRLDDFAGFRSQRRTTTTARTMNLLGEITSGAVYVPLCRSWETVAGAPCRAAVASAVTNEHLKTCCYVQLAVSRSK